MRRFTASCDIILGEATGMQFEFGVATTDSGCVAPGMCVRGERRCSGSGLSIGVLLQVCCSALSYGVSVVCPEEPLVRSDWLLS